eukprot:Gb_41202 [translate_table: standard]
MVFEGTGPPVLGGLRFITVELVDGEACHGGEALETSFITCTFQFLEERRGALSFHWVSIGVLLGFWSSISGGAIFLGSSWCVAAGGAFSWSFWRGSTIPSSLWVDSPPPPPPPSFFCFSFYLYRPFLGSRLSVWAAGVLAVAARLSWPLWPFLPTVVVGRPQPTPTPLPYHSRGLPSLLAAHRGRATPLSTVFFRPPSKLSSPFTLPGHCNDTSFIKNEIIEVVAPVSSRHVSAGARWGFLASTVP